MFQGEITSALVAKWNDSGDAGPLTVYATEATTELQKRILLTNSNAANLIVTSINLTTASAKVADLILVGGPIAIPPNAVDINVPIKFIFGSGVSAPVALDEINGTIDLVIEAVA